MSDQKWWATGSNLSQPTALGDLTTNFTGETVFTEAQPLTVRVRKVCVREDRDGAFKGDNDLVISSTSQFGTEPPVQRLHFMRDGTPLGCQEDFFNGFVLSKRDFKDKTLRLRVQVYDTDGVPGELIEGIQAIAQSVAVTFPVTAPYAAGVGFGGPALLKLMDNLDDHDVIVDERLILEARAAGTGHKLLQPGYFVCFAKPVGPGLQLSGTLTVSRQDGTEFEDCSYCVVEVLRDAEDFEAIEIDQKVAKLLSELAGKGQSAKAPIDFLRETLTGYSNYRKLLRASELKSKDERTDEEEELLQELTADEAIKDYLTDG